MDNSFLLLLIVILLVIVLAVVLPFTDLGALRNRVRALLPRRRFETLYLMCHSDTQHGPALAARQSGGYNVGSKEMRRMRDVTHDP